MTITTESVLVNMNSVPNAAAEIELECPTDAPAPALHPHEQHRANLRAVKSAKAAKAGYLKSHKYKDDFALVQQRNERLEREKAEIAALDRIDQVNRANWENLGAAQRAAAKSVPACITMQLLVVEQMRVPFQHNPTVLAACDEAKMSLDKLAWTDCPDYDAAVGEIMARLTAVANESATARDTKYDHRHAAYLAPPPGHKSELVTV